MADINNFKRQKEEYSQVSARVSKDTHQRVLDFSKDNGLTLSKAIHFILEDYFDRDEREKDEELESELHNISSNLMQAINHLEIIGVLDEDGVTTFVNTLKSFHPNIFNLD